MQYKTVIFLSVFSLLPLPLLANTECHFNTWKNYQDTQLLSHKNQSAYLFTASHMAVDADGAPNAYHPDDKGLDYLANAGYPRSSWWKSVLVANPINPREAYRQYEGEFAGYFVSKTSLQDKSKPITDTSRYVDATKIPYVVFPGSYYRMSGTGTLGDLGYAINLETHEKTAFVIADIGPSKADLGEVSVAFAEALGGDKVSPKNGSGTPKGEILYIVFPYSSANNPWPLSLDELENSADRLLAQAGGLESTLACLSS